MPTAIEKIQAKAKALRKSYPNAKWTDLIKKASTELKKIGSIGATSKKKKATKKAATKKTVSKRKPKVVKVLKQHGTSARAYDKRHQALPAGRRISKSGRAYTETRSNRSDKGVLLGMGCIFKSFLQDIYQWIKIAEQQEYKIAILKNKLKDAKKNKLTPVQINIIKQELNWYVKELKSSKKHIALLKKHIK